ADHQRRAGRTVLTEVRRGVESVPARLMHPLEPLLAPRSMALVGASRKPNTPVHDMVRMLRRGGYRGSVHAINPNYDSIDDYPCVANLADLPAPPDLAVLSVRNERLEETLAQAIAVGARSAVIFAS